MPTWGEILNELNQTAAQMQGPPFDVVRRKYLAEYANHTGRNTILYATAFTQQTNAPPFALMIVDEDLQGLMEVTHGLRGGNLDLILHSPGGSPEAAEAFVHYLRSKFSHIRAIVPHEAMSAASMIACACDEIIMGKHSFLGPIDPQFVISTQLGIQSVPAQAIIDQFKQAQVECADPDKVNAWYPILSQYGPALIRQCENALALSQELVADWLAKYIVAPFVKTRREHFLS